MYFFQISYKDQDLDMNPDSLKITGIYYITITISSINLLSLSICAILSSQYLGRGRRIYIYIFRYLFKIKIWI